MHAGERRMESGQLVQLHEQVCEFRSALVKCKGLLHMSLYSPRKRDKIITVIYVRFTENVLPTVNADITVATFSGRT
jgi:hypothetical protein